VSEEEKPIRVVDRRMFTADGELRPGFEPEEKAEAAQPSAPSAATPPPPTPPSTAPPSAASEAPAREGTEPPAESATSQAFIGLVSFLASNIYAALGIDPMTGERLPRKEPAVARQMIDWLGALEQKTRGRMSFEESDLLSRVLYELRMAYVEVVQPPGREPPR
jgi:type IV secretory pathway VirB10-like protein